jgi:Flp pilus assembly protein TadG
MTAAHELDAKTVFGRLACGRGRLRTLRPREDRGAVALYMALIMVGLLVMAGLVIDGGAAIAARGRAADVAEQAARGGADALSPASLRGPGPDSLALDEAAARAAATRVLSLAGATGEVQVSGLQVSVTAHVPRRAVILSAVGVADLTGTATATATVLHGTTTGSP